MAGAEVHEELLEPVAPGGSGCPLADLLSEAVGARVLVEPEHSSRRHRFSHDLYRETLLAGVPPSRRRSLHLAVGRELLAMRAAGADVHAAEVALHLLASGAPEAGVDAVRCSAEAAAEAMSRLGYEDAAEHYERALAAADRMEHSEPAQRLELLFGLADARYRSGNGPAARAVLQRAVELARRTADPAALARAAVALHDLGARGVGPEATATTALLESAAAALPADPPSALRARVLTALVRSMRHQAVAVDQRGSWRPPRRRWPWRARRRSRPPWPRLSSPCTTRTGNRARGRSGSRSSTRCGPPRRRPGTGTWSRRPTSCGRLPCWSPATRPGGRNWGATSS